MAHAKPQERPQPPLSVPISSLPWKVVEDHVLNTPLGVDDCRVEVLDTDAYRVLKPGEDERIRKIQARLFCEWVIETRGVILGPQLRYLLEVFGLTQGVLAEAVQVSASAISQLISGKNTPSSQTARELALLFCLESSSPGTISSLAENRVPAATQPAPARPSKVAAVKRKQATGNVSATVPPAKSGGSMLKVGL